MVAVQPSPTTKPQEYDVTTESGALFKCICGFSAFSQLIFEEHSCSFATPEIIKAATTATSMRRLQDAGLSSEHFVDTTSWFKEPPTVVVRDAHGNEIWGPQLLNRSSTTASLTQLVLEVIGRPDASLSFCYQDKPINPDDNLLELLPSGGAVSLKAVFRNVSLELRKRSGFYGSSPDVITEISIMQASEADFQAEVSSTCLSLRDICGKYEMGCTCQKGIIHEGDAKQFLPILEQKAARGMSCTSYAECLGKDYASVDNFLTRAGAARFWKHDAYGAGQIVLIYASGHLIRFSVMSEDSQPSKSLTVDYQELRDMRPLTLAELNHQFRPGLLVSH